MSFEDWLTLVSLRTMLQKSLTDCLPLMEGDMSGIVSVPMGNLKLQHDQKFCYFSAIAHAHLGRQAQPEWLAQRLDEAWAIARDRGAPFAHVSRALWPHVHIAATTQGPLQISVTAAGVAAWQHWVGETEAPAIPSQGASWPLTSLSKTVWPLCDRLRISPPVLLRWAYVRCNRWQQYLETLPYPVADEDCAAILKSPPTVHEFCQRLLHTLIDTLDQMAKRLGDIATYWRQGYRLSAAIYQGDAQLASCLSSAAFTASETNIAALTTTIHTCKTVLAVLATKLLGTLPPPSL